MTFHLMIKQLNSVNWRDADLEKIQMSYDKVSIFLTESTGKETIVECHGFIGLQCLPIWDEFIIENAYIDPEHTLNVDLTKKLSQAVKSGSPARNKKNWVSLVITLLDGGEIVIICNSLLVK